MKRNIEDDDDYEGSHEEQQIHEFAQWIEDHYAGDVRFTNVELNEPGESEGETFRLRLMVNDSSHFFVSVFADESFLRIGLATDDQDVNEEVEEVMLESGGSMTDFLAGAMERSDLDHEVQQFEEDIFYYCTDIPFKHERELASQSLREEVVAYVEGYADALLEHLK